MDRHTPVRELMSREVRTLERNDVLTVGDELMKAERIRHLPVLDETGSLVGIVSQRDIFRGALARALGYGEHAQSRLMSQLLVKEVMSNDPVTIAPDATLGEAAARMRELKIGCLPVVENGRLVGILTEGDFVQAFTQL